MPEPPSNPNPRPRRRLKLWHLGAIVACSSMVFAAARVGLRVDSDGVVGDPFSVGLFGVGGILIFMTASIALIGLPAFLAIKLGLLARRAFQRYRARLVAWNYAAAEWFSGLVWVLIAVSAIGLVYAIPFGMGWIFSDFD